MPAKAETAVRVQVDPSVDRHVSSVGGSPAKVSPRNRNPPGQVVEATIWSSFVAPKAVLGTFVSVTCVQAASDGVGLGDGGGAVGEGLAAPVVV